MGIKQKDLGTIKEADNLVGNWYANIFILERRNLIIFMNEKTLLSFVLVGIRKDNIKNISKMFYGGLKKYLSLEGFHGITINQILSEYEDVEFTKTESRSLLGNLNELVKLYKYRISYDDGLKHCDMTDIIQSTNRMPMRNIEWKYAIDAFSDLLSEDSTPIEPDSEI